MSFFEILNLMLPLIIVGLIGYVLSFVKKIDIKIISDLVIYVTSPCLFIIALSTNNFETEELFVLIFTCAAVILLTAAVTWLLRKKIELPLGLYLPVIFMNSGFVGLPLIIMLYGATGLARAIVYDVVNGIFIFSLGIFIVSGKKDKWQIFKLPILYAAAAGILLNLGNIDLPTPFAVSLSMVGSMTIPLALIMLGYQLGKTKIKELKLPLLGTVLRAGLGILVAVIIVKLFRITGALSNILIIMSALPAALNGVVLTEKYRPEDSQIVASTIAVSILSSIIYLPLLLSFLR